MAAANLASGTLCLSRDSRVMRWLRVFPGVTRQVAEARGFVAFLLAACPAREDAVACVSELAANAVIHTESGHGGFFSVEVTRFAGLARICVTDQGAPTVPEARPLGTQDELEAGGLGLAVVAARASRWGYDEAGPGRTVWAEVCWPVGGASPASRPDPGE